MTACTDAGICRILAAWNCANYARLGRPKTNGSATEPTSLILASISRWSSPSDGGATHGESLNAALVGVFGTIDERLAGGSSASFLRINIGFTFNTGDRER